MRINARFDDEAERQIHYLTETPGQSASDIVREAVARYYREVRGERVGLRHFATVIGKGDSGRSDLASNFRKYVYEAVDAKRGLRPK